MSVLLETSYGDLVIDLYDHLAPKTSLNFLKLCQVKYYNDCEFFRIEKGFIAQTGDPLNNGTGGESIFSKYTSTSSKFFPPETSMKLTHARKGTVSMASASPTPHAPKGHGSQFFITLADGLDYLDFEHTVFGHVAEGMSVLDRIADTFVDEKMRPFRVIRIRHTIVLHDPFDDLPGLPLNCPSPEPAQGAPEGRLASDEDDDPFEGDDDEARMLRIKKLQDEQEAKSRAEVLEIIGDIGDAEMKPPENVLFICKLNPVTEPDDLEIIFSRFGECKVDILRDRETGESLCYGFIEYETKEQCERAYFKMDSALIDDRRVHVDFSQSVSKLWNARMRWKSAGHEDVGKRKKSLNQKRPCLK